MNELDYILIEHGIMILKDDTDDQNANQQMDPNNQEQQIDKNLQQDPNTQDDENDTDINAQQYDEDGNPIPNTVESSSSTNTIQTPEFSNEEVAARYNVIEDYKKISSMAKKIREIKFYDTSFDLEEMLISIESILKYVSSFSTDDLIKYKDFLIDKLSSNLIKIKTGLSEVDKDREKQIQNKMEEKSDVLNNLKEDFDFLFQLNRKIKLDLNIDSAVSMLTQAIYKKIHSLDEEDFVDIYGYRYKSNVVMFILRDAAEILSKLYNKKEIILNDGIGVYLFNYADNYYKKEGVSIIFDPIVQYDPLHKKIVISRIPDQFSIIHFSIHLRCALLDYLRCKKNKNNSDIKYNDSVVECQKLIIKKIGEKVFKNENIIDTINQIIKDGYFTNEQSINLEYLTRFDSKANKLTNPSYISSLEKWIALISYYNSVNIKTFPEWDKMFIKSYKEGFEEYLENYVNELEHIFYIRKTDNTENLLSIIQGFSNIQFLTSNLERQ